MKSFVVEFWANVFAALRWVSFFEPIRRIFPRLKTHGAVDVWVLGNLVAAIVCVAVAPHLSSRWITVPVVWYALLRVFEVVVYQMNVLLFDEYRALKMAKSYALRGYRRVVLLLLHNYLEIVLWFGAIYVILAPEFQFSVPGTAGTTFGGIYSSFIVMTTFGDSNISPKAEWGALLILIQSGVGLFMSLVSLARFISLIPTPESSDEFEK